MNIFLPSATRRSNMTRAAVGAGALLAGMALAAGTASAAPTPAPPTPGAPPVAAEAPAASMREALQRDLGLSPEQASQRLAAEATAADTEQVLAAELGADFAGAYFEPGAGALTVAITDPARADEVWDAGATPSVVARDDDDLDRTQDELDAEVEPGSGVTGSYVDPATNTVVLTALPGARDEAAEQIAEADVDADSVRVVQTDAAPELYVGYRGGDPYYINNQFVCSVGFPVRSSSGVNGFVTAGHCGASGSSITNPQNQGSGTFRGSSFPGNDYAWVQSNSNFTGLAQVNRYDGTAIVVRGQQTAPVGASVCRSGQTTGWKCGTIQSRNQSVFYAEGTVSGLTRTSACAEGGDSGGSWMSGTQAQGVTSGGSGNCRTGGTTFFQPLGEVLNAYGLTLLTS